MPAFFASSRAKGYSTGWSLHFSWQTTPEHCRGEEPAFCVFHKWRKQCDFGARKGRCTFLLPVQRGNKLFTCQKVAKVSLGLMHPFLCVRFSAARDLRLFPPLLLYWLDEKRGVGCGYGSHLRYFIAGSLTLEFIAAQQWHLLAGHRKR